MGAQSEIPWYHSDPRIGQSIADLLVRQGDIQAQRAERSGQLWGRAVENIGGIAADVVQQRGEEQQRQKREAMLGEAMQSWNPEDPRDFMKKMVSVGGPDLAIAGVRAMTAWEESRRKAEPDPKLLATKAEFIGRMWKQAPDFVRKNWATIASTVPEVTPLHGLEVGQEWDEQKYAPLLDSLSPKDDQKLVPVAPNTTLYDPEKRAAVYTAPAAPKEEKPDTRSLDARYAEAVATGDTATAQTLLQAKARLEAAGRAPEKAGAGSKMWVVRDGKTIRIGEDEYQPGDQPTGTRERPVTGAERTALSFFLRAKDASENLAALEDRVVNASPIEQARLQWAPNMLQSDDEQLYRQAQRQFTEARLRKDSGATIKKDEYESDAKTYFAQPGDSVAVLEQKRRARAKALNAIKVTAGRAYAEHFGDEESAAPSDPLGIR